jgi:2-polyprenyl-3-methyl-5-hydroxy-6-metoxy-1,4-benzoquinol methylase
VAAGNTAVEFHDRAAAGWDQNYAKGHFLKRANFFQNRVMLNVQHGHWLDAGCGSGFFSRILAAEGIAVTGIDASAAMIDVARGLSARAGITELLDFQIVPTVETLPFASGLFDGCLCLSVIEYVDEPEACLLEFARVLRPGGMLIFSLPHRFSPVRNAQRLMVQHLPALAPERWEFVLLSRHARTTKEVTALLDNSGFKMRNVFGFDAALPLPLLKIIPPSLIFAVAVKEQECPHSPPPFFHGSSAERKR